MIQTTRNSRYSLELQGCAVSHPDECPEFLQSLKPVTSVMGNWRDPTSDSRCYTRKFQEWITCFQKTRDQK